LRRGRLLKRLFDEAGLRCGVYSFDIIGDIAILKFIGGFLEDAGVIARRLLEELPNVRVVLGQVSPVSGVFRVRKLVWLAGENRFETVHREYGCLFKVDLSKCYFSPRLQFERFRIAKLVKPNEVVINMFAGVGCFSIIIAKYSSASKIYSIDLNPHAYNYMCENIRLNKVENRVVPILGDAKEIILNRLVDVANRVLMPLPEKAYEYLDYALKALKGEGYIHYYDFVKSGKNENPIKKGVLKVSEKLKSLNVDFEIGFGRVVRSVGPRNYQIVLDIFVKL